VTLVVLFNGQGELRRQHVDRLLGEATAAIAALLASVFESKGLSLRDARDDDLQTNRIAQPVICLYQLAMWRTLAPLLPRPALFAGYSLGELTAFAVAADVEVEDAIALAEHRATLMDEAVLQPAGLLAIAGLPEASVEALCRTHACEIAIRNGPANFVVGGSAGALERLSDNACAIGAIRTSRLRVTTPSHTSRLAGAAVKFGQFLRRGGYEGLRIPVVASAEGRIVFSADALVSALEKQLCTRLDWDTCMDAIFSYRPQAVLEMGPGTALSRLLLDVDPGVEVRSVDDFRHASSIAQWVASRIQ